MELSEDAIAIVASNLTVAHCVAAKGMAALSREDANAVVRQLYSEYQEALRAVSHD